MILSLELPVKASLTWSCVLLLLPVIWRTCKYLCLRFRSGGVNPGQEFSPNMLDMLGKGKYRTGA